MFSAFVGAALPVYDTAVVVVVAERPLVFLATFVVAAALVAVAAAAVVDVDATESAAAVVGVAEAAVVGVAAVVALEVAVASASALDKGSLVAYWKVHAALFLFENLFGLHLLPLDF